MVDSINNTVSLKKQAIDKLSSVLETIEWIQERVNSIISIQESVWDLSDEDIKKLISGTKTPDLIKESLNELLNYKSKIPQDVPLIKLLVVHNKILEQIRVRLYYIEKFFSDLNLSDLDKDLITDFFTTIRKWITVESTISINHGEDNLPSEVIDIDEYKKLFSSFLESLNQIENRVKKFKVFFDKLPNDTPEDVIKDLVNCLVNGESLDNLEKILSKTEVEVEEIVLESKKEKKEQARKEIESKPRTRRVVKHNVNPNKIRKRKEPSKLHIILLAIKKYWNLWVSFKEARNKAREELLNKE